MSGRRRWVVYGSSISTERVRWAPWRACGGAWVAVLRSTRPDIEVLNRSGWGWTSRDAVRAFGPRVLALQPDGVLIEFAINDADERRRCTLEESSDHLTTLLRALAGTNPASRAVVMIPPPPSGRYAPTRPRFSDYAAVWRRTAADHHAALADLAAGWEAFVAAHPGGESACRPDGLHPASAAADWIASVVSSAIDSAPPLLRSDPSPSC
ncbi:MAG: SGNH/GDSL hydrolase family protein [Kiritimatiellae bacterium]|nr:SGNH/GDSL hydrolase family protein [Kiritimatiellia bacterium]